MSGILFRTIADFLRSGIIRRGWGNGVLSIKARRLERAIEAICECIATAAGIPFDQIGHDDDLIDDLALNPLERESLELVIEEIFAIRIPEQIWRSPIYRSPASLAEWAIRHSEHASWIEARRDGLRRHG